MAPFEAAPLWDADPPYSAAVAVTGHHLPNARDKRAAGRRVGIARFREKWKPAPWTTGANTKGATAISLGRQWLESSKISGRATVKGADGGSAIPANKRAPQRAPP